MNPKLKPKIEFRSEQAKLVSGSRVDTEVRTRLPAVHESESVLQRPNKSAYYRRLTMISPDEDSV